MSESPHTAPSFALSPDGTRIAFWSGGTGPPLLLVHGAMSDHRRWRIPPLLEPYRTVHAMDRRGRGESGDGPDWSLEREIDDVVAVVEAVAADSGSDVDVLGHSLGGSLALYAAARSPHVRRLVLYEAAIHEPPAPPDLLARMQALLDEGRREDLVTLMMREVVRMPDAEIGVVRSLPSWPTRVAAAHTLPRELSTQLRWEPEKVARITIPVLLLVGGDSPTSVRDSTDLLAATLLNATVAVIAGQQHVADQLVPELFAQIVLDFVLE